MGASASSLRAPRWCVWLWLIAMAAVHSWQAASVSDEFSTTADEIAHLTAGYSYWQDRDFRLQPENGNFPQRWAALPLLGRELHQLDRSHKAWAEADVWVVGDRFFHQSGNDLAAMLRSGRAMIALLGGALVFVAGVWAWELFGAGGAFVTSALAAFSPTLLAHAGLITSDTAAALGFLLASAVWWRLLHRVTVARVLVAGLALGYLLLAKFSAVLFAPMAVLMLAARLARRTPLNGRHGTARLAPLAAGALGVVFVSWIVVWAGYGFRYSAAGPNAPAGAHFALSWDHVLIATPTTTAFVMADNKPQGQPVAIAAGPVQKFVRWGAAHHVLPEAWLYGFAFVDRSSRYRPAFFAGEWSATGWTAFFPVAYLLKSTLPEIALHLAGLAALLAAAAGSRRGRTLLYKSSPLLVVLLVYGAFSVRTSLNIGHRHILPMYACVSVLAGGVAVAHARRATRAMQAGVAVLLVAHAGASALARPDYLAYFNELAGGSAGGYRYFVDSSLDWGQDLPRLKRWLDARGDHDPVFLSYFGSGSPRYYGIEATRIGDSYFDFSGAQRPIVPQLRGGWFVISATMWQRVYTHVRGPWTASYEARYQQMRPWLRQLNATLTAPAHDPEGRVVTAGELSELLIDFEHLRFGRLCYFLRGRAPDALIGATFFAFHLSDAELNYCLSAPIPPEEKLP
jgi:hypothetical protein